MSGDQVATGGSGWKRRAFYVPAVIVVLLAGFFGWLAWISISDPRIDFLDSRGPAAWILYPKPPNGSMHVRPATELSTIFHHSFVLGASANDAELAIRAMRRWTVEINGMAVANPGAEPNWKRVVSLNVARQLHPGTNEIAVTVYNDNGPPALWLALKSGPNTIVSDEDWDASFLDAVPRKAVPAYRPADVGRGNPFYGGERPWPSFLNHLPALAIIGVFSLALLLRGGWWLSRYQANGERWGPVHSVSFAVLAIGVVALLWTVLWFHNLGVLPAVMGFDANDHLDYIHYLGKNGRLPLANEGWQMYQPPLYYVLAAMILAPIQAIFTNSGAVEFLRFLGLAVGIVHCWLVLLGLRLLFPQRLGLQVFGFVLAVFLPENLYICQYITNESLAAMLATAAIYLCLRILKTDSDSKWLHLGLGLCLGASLLAKFTGLVAVPFLGIALAGRLFLKREFGAQIWARTVGLAVVAALAVCGWHYWRVWRHFGNPLVGNWDPASGYHWWMEPGFHTAAFFFRFGNSLRYPWHSGFDGFADGLYSTLWGDGLWGGMVEINDRPPWNYGLMAAGFVLALVPTILILAGLARAVWRFMRQPDLSWLLLLGVAFGTLAALLYMSLKLPSSGQVKAFYGMIALLPICALGALGWEFVMRRGKVFFLVAGTLTGVWAINNYASYWIDEKGPDTGMVVARQLIHDGHPEAAVERYAEEARRNPRDKKARTALAVNLFRQQRAPEARQMLAGVLADEPENAENHRLMAVILSTQNQLEPALDEIRKAIDLAPDSPVAYVRRCDILNGLGRYADAVAVGREGLHADAMLPELHYQIGVAAAQLKDFTNALFHFRLALRFRPAWPEAQARFNGVLAQLIQLNAASAPPDPKHELTDYERHRSAALANETEKPADAVREFRELLKQNPEDLLTLNDLAWLLATHTDAQIRDGVEALRLAEKACGLSNRKTARYVGTLAAARAETGQFYGAAIAASEAINLAEASGDEMVAEINRKLREIYRVRQPFHGQLKAAPRTKP